MSIDSVKTMTQKPISEITQILSHLNIFSNIVMIISNFKPNSKPQIVSVASCNYTRPTKPNRTALPSSALDPALKDEVCRATDQPLLCAILASIASSNASSSAIA